MKTLLVDQARNRPQRRALSGMNQALERLLLALCLTIGCTIALAQEGATEQRIKRLSEELRCLVCQNQTIADSNADLATDLKRELRHQIAQGKSDDEVRAFMVARYGDFVLFKPPMKSATALLWIGPFALLLVGGLIWWRVVGRSRRRTSPSLNPEAVNRARALLEGDAKD